MAWTGVDALASSAEAESAELPDHGSDVTKTNTNTRKSSNRYAGRSDPQESTISTGGSFGALVSEDWCLGDSVSADDRYISRS